MLGVIAMMAISSPQYVWTLFTGPLNQKLGTTLPQLQWTFSLLIILQTWLSPFQAYLVDRFGPRTADFDRCAVLRRQLAALGLRRQYLGALFHLRRARRIWHRHHLCRHHWLDGALVSRPPRFGGGPRRRRLWLRRIFHELPDRQHDQELGLCAYPHCLGHHPGGHRHCRGAMVAFASRRLFGAQSGACRRRRHAAIHARLLAARNAAKSDLLFAVLDDEPDVDVGLDGHVECRPVRQGIRRRRRAGAGHGRPALVAHAFARNQWPDPAVLWLGVRPDRPRDRQWRWLFRWKPSPS